MAKREITASRIATDNNIATNYQTELIALRAAEVAPYFTVGSKKFIDDSELVNKRNGQTYGFVIRDRAQVENQLEVTAGAKKDIVEREVQLSIEPWHVYVKNNAVEGKTDLQFDQEVAEPNGLALIQEAVKKSIAKDFSNSATAFVGNVGEFEPLSMATGYLGSIITEPLYGFVDHMIEAIVTSKGAQFVPVDAPAMYKQGLIGHFHGADYRSQRFVPRLRVSKALADALEGATFGGFAIDENGKSKLTITFGTAAAAATKVQKGMPFFIDGVVACDTIGDPTTQPYAFIAKADAVVASGATSVVIEVEPIDVRFGGTREAALEDGSAINWASLPLTTGVSAPAEGVYFTGIIRANGVFEFQTLNDVDVCTPESTKGSVQGITVFRNRMTDMDAFTTGTRLDTFTMSGVVDKRAQAVVYVKAR